MTSKSKKIRLQKKREQAGRRELELVGGGECR
jgi:hypothetical protein